MVTPYQEEQGAPGLRPRNKALKAERQDPPGSGVESRGIPLGKEEATWP